MLMCFQWVFACFIVSQHCQFPTNFVYGISHRFCAWNRVVFFFNRKLVVLQTFFFFLTWILQFLRTMEYQSIRNNLWYALQFSSSHWMYHENCMPWVHMICLLLVRGCSPSYFQGVSFISFELSALQVAKLRVRFTGQISSKSAHLCIQRTVNKRRH